MGDRGRRNGESRSRPVETGLTATASSPVVLTKVRIPSAPSMPVERLDGLLDVVWRHRLALVVAPAGSGKTTLLARFAGRAPGPVGWYRAEAWDRDEATMLRHVEAALAPSMEGVPRDWSTVADAANALAGWQGGPALLVVDDLHTIAETPAEAALERLIDYAPASLTVIAASRVPPAFNLPRLRVSGLLVEIGSDDLRFRSWEVERLFRDFYEEPLPPEELARLARSTEGWAAGLQLFHLATRGKPPDERRRVLTALGPSSRLMRDYLTRNVVHELPDDLRRFLVETSVLGRLSGTLCDRLLDRTGSGEVLLELERRRLFTHALPEDGVYRYHEVLRSYLQGVLVEEVGEARSRERFRSAGELLAETGAMAEALEAFCRAEDGDSARRLLGRDGQAVAGRSSAWVDAIPASMLLHDPWLLLATARRLRSEGRFAAAVERYQRAEVTFGSMDTAVTCREERQALSAWLESGSSTRIGWSSVLRSALRRDPMSVARDVGPAAGAEAPLVRGLALLVAGEVSESRRRLGAVAEDPTSGPVGRVVAALAAGVAAILAGQPHGAIEVQGAVASAESLGLDWLARLGRASIGLGGDKDAVREAEAVAEACVAVSDAWGEAVARLCAAWGSVCSGRDPGVLDRLISVCRSLESPVLEGWVRGLSSVALARAGAPDAEQAAVQAEAAARSAGVPAARLLSSLALGELSADEGYRELTEQIAAETGLRSPSLMHGDGRPAAGAPSQPIGARTRLNGHAPAEVPPLRISLLGGFAIELDGAVVELGGIRPRVRTLLRLLALHAGSPVHHETIEAALWPDADPEGGSRNLHVAVAALRRAIEPDASRGGFELVRREGDAYRLAVPPGGEVDLQRFEQGIVRARAARAAGDLESATANLETALGTYRGELLPEDGPAEWVTERRDLCHAAAVDAAQALGEVLLLRGDPAGAARACTEGLRIERYHDPLWRLLIEARDRAGDPGAATRARMGYDRMLAELGVDGRESAALVGGPVRVRAAALSVVRDGLVRDSSSDRASADRASSVVRASGAIRASSAGRAWSGRLGSKPHRRALNSTSRSAIVLSPPWPDS
jgi:DNA-binding SARP family transcriptional activator